jgi:predicted DNA-binding protein
VLAKFTKLAMISKDSESAKKPRPNIGARLPHEVYEKFLQVKELSGKSESQLINEAIALYLGVGHNTVPDRLTALETAIQQVQGEVETILGKFQRLVSR